MGVSDKMIQNLCICLPNMSWLIIMFQNKTAICSIQHSWTNLYDSRWWVSQDFFWPIPRFTSQNRRVLPQTPSCFVFLSFPGWKNWATFFFPQLPRFLVSKLIIEISSCPNMQTKPSAFRRWSASCRLAMASWRAFGPGLKTNLWWRCTGMAQRLQGNS